MDYNSLAHTTWECKYHIVFAPKFRRKIIYNQLRADIGRILSELCKRKGVEIIEAEACPDHIQDRSCWQQLSAVLPQAPRRNWQAPCLSPQNPPSGHAPLSPKHLQRG